MARGWSHREAAFLTRLGAEAGCQLGLRLHVASAWQLPGSRTSQVPAWLGLQKKSVPVNQAEAALPVLSLRSQAASPPLRSAGYEQGTDPPGFKGRRKRPCPSMEECRGLTVDQERR